LFAGAGARFANNTVPDSKWWSGLPSNLSIDQISPVGAVVSFRSLLGDAAVPTETLRRESQPNRDIPDNDSAGISDTITMTEAGTIASIKVALDITHSFRGDLHVTLTTPWGTVIELQPKNQGGSADDLKVIFDETSRPALSTLRGRSIQGAWRLGVQDLAASDVGRLNRWGLELTLQGGNANQPVQLQESPGAAIPDNDGTGITRALSTTEAGQVGAVEVALDISHTYIGDLRVRLVSPSGAQAILHDRAGGSDDNIGRTYTAATTPALGALTGQPIAGIWKLVVSDHAADDVGKLNRWSLTLRRP
jgi:subtilisin-like proprotein convertase family protein